MAYTSLLTETRGRVGLITFNRPQALNALNPQLLEELLQTLEIFDADIGIGAILLTGSARVFAAGADIKFMVGASSVEMRANGFVEMFEGLRRIRKPIIAAVSGFALGGGCELALACDLIVASETARFGQPEINLGVIPGGGGTQRLARALGKALSMEIVLNNRTLSAAEALHFGLVNRVVPVELFLDESLSLAAEIAARAPERPGLWTGVGGLAALGRHCVCGGGLCVWRAGHARLGRRARDLLGVRDGAAADRARRAAALA